MPKSLTVVHGLLGIDLLRKEIRFRSSSRHWWCYRNRFLGLWWCCLNSGFMAWMRSWKIYQNMSRFFSLAESCGASMISFIRCSASYIGGRIKKFCHQRLLWNPKAIMLLFCYVNVWPAFLSRLWCKFVAYIMLLYNVVDRLFRCLFGCDMEPTKEHIRFYIYTRYILGIQTRPFHEKLVKVYCDHAPSFRWLSR